MKFIWDPGISCTQGTNGIRIKVDNTAPNGPRAALGREGDGKIGVMVLDFKLNTPHRSTVDLRTRSILARCVQDNKASLNTCIQSTVIHEFGHVLGLAHEQNRPDDPLIPFRGACNFEDTDPNVIPGIGSFTTFGNTLFTDYDAYSIMNYCRSKYFGRIDLSPLDKMAARVYYGQMPSFDSRTLVLTVPRINAGSIVYTATLVLGPDNKFRITTVYGLTNPKPSLAPATLSSSGTLSFGEFSFINNVGHVNQILSATLTLANPNVVGVYNTKIQPTVNTPSLDSVSLL